MQPATPPSRTPRPAITLGSAGKQVFHYDDEPWLDVEGGQTIQSRSFKVAKSLKQSSQPSQPSCYRPKLWWLLVGSFVCISTIMFGILVTLWYLNNSKAESEILRATNESLNDYAKTSHQSISSLVHRLDSSDLDLVKSKLGEYLDMPFSAVDMMKKSMDLKLVQPRDLDSNLKYMWGLVTALPRQSQHFSRDESAITKLEDVFLADVNGTYLGYTNQCVNPSSRTCLAKAPDWSFGLDYKPGVTDITGIERCPEYCAGFSSNLSKEEAVFYTADGSSGKPLLLKGHKAYDPRGRPWYDLAVEARSDSGSIPVWTGVYSDVLKDDGGHPDFGMSVAQAHYEGDDLVMVAGSTITLRHLTRIVMQQRVGSMSGTADDSSLFIIDRKGQMVASDGGFDQVVQQDSNGSVRQLLHNETNNSLVEFGMESLIKRYGTDFSKIKDSQLHNSCGENGKYFCSHATLHSGVSEYYSLHLIIVRVQPRNRFTKQILDSLGQSDSEIVGTTKKLADHLRHSLLLTGLVCSGSILFGAALLVIIARQVTWPLRQIVKDMSAVSKLELDVDKMSCHDNKSLIYKVREIENMNNTFVDMAAGLRSFSRYMDPYVVQLLLLSRQEAQLGVAKADVTIFFSDIANFTTIAETMEPTHLMKLLGDYLSEMSDIIMKHSGVVGEFVGDAIMAWWNVPWEFQGGRHTVVALASAMEQQQRLSELRQQWCQRGFPEVWARMGLVRSQVLAGNVGSRERMKYGLVGDGVNLASRLEGLCKKYQVQVLVDRATYDSPGVVEEFFLRPVDLVAVKGRQSSTELFEVVASKYQVRGTSLHDMYSKFCKDFTEIQEAYRAGQFEQALKLAEEYEKIWPSDQPCRILKARSKELLDHPPGEDWTPIDRLCEK